VDCTEDCFIQVCGGGTFFMYIAVDCIEEYFIEDCSGSSLQVYCGGQYSILFYTGWCREQSSVILRWTVLKND